MSEPELDLGAGLRRILDGFQRSEAFPHGPDITRDEQSRVGEALVRLRGGDKDTARTAWAMIVEDCGGYFPEAAAKAILHAANPNLVPDVKPDPRSDIG